MTASEAVAARQKAIQSLQGEAQTGVSKEVVSLYGGAVHNLYTYKVYTDVRFVFIVEYQAGFFGGDPDNFTYPALLHGRGDVPRLRERQAGLDAELPEVVGRTGPRKATWCSRRDIRERPTG